MIYSKWDQIWRGFRSSKRALNVSRLSPFFWSKL